MSLQKNRRQRHAFRSQTTRGIVARALMRDELLQHPRVRIALNDYLISLNLQNRVNQGSLTPNQALIEFEKAIHTFSRSLHTELERRWARNRLDQTDLSNPLNMQTALRDPSSYACQLMNNTQAAIEEAINNEISNNQQNFIRMTEEENQQANIQQNQQAETQENSAPQETTYNEAEKAEALTAAIVLFDEKGIDAAKYKIVTAFAKHAPGIKTDFDKIEEEASHEEHSLLQKVLKPEFKDFNKKDKQEE